MELTYQPQESFKRAKQLFEVDDVNSLRYACLELRYCLEAIVYKKLYAFKDNIPCVIIDTWQPNKAIRMLNKIDHAAADWCMIEVNLNAGEVPPEEGWMKLGEQNMPSAKWINKAYNKLGNFLHLPEPKKIQNYDTKKIREAVGSIIEDIRPFVFNSFFVKTNTLKLETCKSCKNELIYDLNNVNSGCEICCDNPKCRMVYEIVRNSKQGIQLRYKSYSVHCEKCTQLIEVPHHLIVKEGKFSCSSCGKKYLVRCNYEIAPIKQS